MRSFCLNTILAACLLGGVTFTARAEIMSRIEIDVPFAFQVGNVAMPAGSYEIYQPHETGAVIVRATGGSGAVATVVAPMGEGGGTHASFVHTGGKYFLSSVSLGDGRMVHIIPSRLK
jgi:hypothetical protein